MAGILLFLLFVAVVFLFYISLAIFLAGILLFLLFVVTVVVSLFYLSC